MTRTAALIVTILLLLPLSTAFVDDVQILYQGAPLTYLPDGEFQATINFSTQLLQETHQITQIIDGELTTIATIFPSNSPIVTGMTSIQPTEPIRIRFEVQGEADTPTFEFDVPRDEQAPVIEYIRLGECEQECAYSQQSTIEVAIQDQGASLIDPSSVQANFAGAQNVECPETPRQQIICEIALSSTNSGELTISAQDRAGNSQQASIQLIYDSNPPIIQTNTMQFIDLYGTDETTLTELPGGVPAVFELIVEEEQTPRITFSTEFTREEAECTETDTPGEYRCEVSFTPPNEQLDVTARINVTDPAGNVDQRTQGIRIFESNQDITPEFWEASGHAMKHIDHETWAVNNISVPIAIALESSITGTPQPILIQAESCAVKGAQASSRAGTIEARIPPSKTTQVELRIGPQGRDALDPESPLLNEPEITCELEVYSRLAGITYTNPQTVTVTITPEFLTALPAPPEAIRIKAQQAAEKSQRIGRTYQAVQQITSAVRALCAPPRRLDTGSRALSLGASGLYATGFAGPADGLNQAGGALGRTSENILSFVGGSCNALRCPADSSDETFLSGLGLGAIDNSFATAAGVENPSQLVDPYKSIIVAGATGCIPAILYHYEQMQAVRCAEQQCISQIPTGTTSAEMCSYGKREAMCELVGGHLINAIPTANIMSTALDRYASIFSSPLSMVGGISTIGCAIADSGAAASGPVAALCRVSAAGQRAGEIGGVINDIDSYVSQISNFGQSAQNACSAIQQSVAAQDRRPFVINQNCRGAYSVHDEGGSRFIAINGDVCEVDGRQLDRSELDADTQTYRSISGYQLNCHSQNSQRSDVLSAHEQCIEDGFVADLRELDSYSEAQEQREIIRGYEEDKQDNEDEYLGITRDISSDIMEINNKFSEYNQDVGNFKANGETVYVDVGDNSLVITPQNMPTQEQILSGDLSFAQQKFVDEYDLNPNDPEIQELQNNIAEKEERLTEIEEEQAGIDEDIEAAEEERDDYLKRVQREAYAEGLSGTAGFLKGFVGSAAGYGQLGATLDRTFGIGIADTGFGGFFTDVSQTLADASDLGAEAVGNLVCGATNNQPPQREANIQSRTGEPIAHINGVVTQYTSTNAYRVDVGVTNIGEEAATARVYLRGDDGEHELRNDITLGGTISFMGSQALGQTLSDNYDQACIEFSSSIESLFGEARTTGSTTSRTLCAQLRVNTP